MTASAPTKRSLARRAWGDIAARQQPQFALEMPPAPPKEEADVLSMVQKVERGGHRILLDACPVPMPPSMNDYWHQRVVFDKTTKRPLCIRYTSEKAKAYQEAVRSFMLDRKAWYRSEHQLEMRVLLCFKDTRLNDLDNRIKPLQDALAHAHVFENDLQVRHIEVRQGPNLTPAIAYVTLVEIIPDKIANRDWIKGDRSGR